MYSLIIFGPVFIFFLCLLFGRFMGGFYTALAVAVSTFFSVCFSFDAIIFMVSSNFTLVYYFQIATLIDVNFFQVAWHSYFDYLTLSIFCLITLVSFFIQIFSIGYIAEDASFVRFITYLCFFIIAMLLLVGSSNFFQIFFGWELVGLASFLLINFWFARQDANISAYKAVAVNRVGDCFILLAIFIFVYLYQTVEFDMLFSVFVVDFWTSLAFLFVVFGAFAKSAQFFFQGWLPDAMEGPTPVSALLHSATMVTAGVFLTLRFMDMLSSFDFIRYLVVFFGLLTALYAMSVAAVSDDTKRATAYTTLNQLGFMFFGCGSLAGATVLFHLIVHGFYKSFSFLSAATELYDLEDEQDGEFDYLDSNAEFSYYDILSSLVFVSINAIPFTSPSISKEFMLLSGIENSADYLTFFVTVILFSSPVDEGRDDVDDYVEYNYYVDDIYVPGSFPITIIVSVTSLGIISILSATILEEFFLDINFFWSSTNVNFSWVDTKGTFLIFLPFFSIVASEFDFSRVSKVQDFNFNSVVFREDSRYQNILFNADLWFYDEIIAKISSNFYKFSNFFANQSLDKAYLEYYYIDFVYYLTKHFDSNNKYSYNSIEKVYPASLFFIIFAASIFYVLPFLLWITIIIFVLEFIFFFIFQNDFYQSSES
jgi:NADH:ubiquinone oxidoreductase subunit 5 (subunit L)/multisubunit Na+/H+ antiporter MnhA subunit